MSEVAIAANGERIGPPFSESDLERVDQTWKLPHNPEYCDYCQKRAEEIEDMEEKADEQ